MCDSVAQYLLKWSDQKAQLHKWHKCVVQFVELKNNFCFQIGQPIILPWPFEFLAEATMKAKIFIKFSPDRRLDTQ